MENRREGILWSRPWCEARTEQKNARPAVKTAGRAQRVGYHNYLAAEGIDSHVGKAARVDPQRRKGGKAEVSRILLPTRN